MNTIKKIISKNFTTFLLLKFCFMILFMNSCKKEQAPQQMISSANVDDLKANITVHSGESIQAAVDAAQPNWVIKIEPGTYSESIVVNKAGIKLIGISGGGSIIIQNPGAAEDGIEVGDAGDGFMLKNVTVQNFEENGVVLDSVENFTISNVTALNNGEYGIFPVHSAHGKIDHCFVSGHTDTGLYIGQSSDVDITYNQATGNVNGIEVENATDINVTNNESYDNVCGILIDLLPGKDIKTSNNVYIAHNHVYKNNHINFGEEGSLESFVPSGLGILVLGTDETTVEDNVVNGNNFSGITVFSTLVLGVLADIPPEYFADIEPNPDGVIIRENKLNRNGAEPPVLDIPLPGVDLLWDGSGTNNCWKDNSFKTSSPDPLPSCD